MFRPFGAAANTGTGGGFGTGTTPNPNPFGGFGAAPAPTATTGATGMGVGGAGMFGTGGGFGAGGAGFGGAIPTAGTTGMGMMGAGQNAMGMGFGATLTAGTGNPPYTSTNEQEGTQTVHLYCISAMPAYRGKSLEELRLEDYQAGKKTASGFASTTATPGQQPSSFSFGVGNQGTSTTSGTASPFGFGAARPATGTVGGGFGGFGQQAPAITAGTGFGASNFGAQTATTTPSSFGGGAFGTTTGTTGFNIGGQAAQPVGGSIFGGQTSTTPAAGAFGSFGAVNQTAQPAANLTPGSGGFGGFGTQTAAASPFGAQTGTAAPSFGMFGQQNQAAVPQATATGFGGFGGKPATSTTSGGVFNFGATNPTGTTAGTSGMFGGAGGLTQPQQQQQPTAFNFGATTATAAAPTAASTTPGFNFGTTPAAMPAFSFGTPTSGTVTTTAPATTSTFNFGGAKPLGSTLSLPSATSKISAPATSFSFGNTQLGGTSITPSQASSTNLPLITPPDSRLLSLKPPLPFALSSSLPATSASTSTTATIGQTKPARLTGDFVPRTGFRLTKTTSTASITSSSGTATLLVPKSSSSLKTLTIPKETKENEEILNQTTESTDGHYGDFYMVPSESTLKRMSYSQLASISNFTIGQYGIGQVRFLRPVDLTSVDLEAILDNIVVFGQSQVVIYPEDVFPEKPPVGTGLNQPAEIRLERCWPTSRSTRDPITEMGSERMRRHIERLKSVPDTHFVDFVPESGTWIFTVEHF